MINGWIIERKHRVIETQYWVCVEKEDALAIANDIMKYWKKEYEPHENWTIDTQLYADQVFHFHIEDALRITVSPQEILESGDCL